MDFCKKLERLSKIAFTGVVRANDDGEMLWAKRHVIERPERFDRETT